MNLASLGLRVDSSDLRRARGDLGGFRREAGQAGDGARRFGIAARMGLGAAAAAAAGLATAALSIGAAINTIAEFEAAMSRVGAISRASSTDMVRMRETVRELGATTMFSATQAAEGMGFLAMAGFSAVEGIEALPGVLSLAAAAGMDLGTAADIASNIMSGFGVAASASNEVADLLAATASRANTSVEQLGEAMKYAAPVANALGIPMSDAAAAIGKLSDAGIQGSMAGTSLRTILASLAAPTTMARAALADLNVTMADLDPATNSLSEIVGTLAAANLDAASAIRIFGREGAAGILALTGQTDALAVLSDELENVDGTAGDMADTMADNLQGDIRTLGSAVESLILSMGEAGLTAVLRALVEILVFAVRGLEALVGVIGSVVGVVQAAGRGLFNLGTTTDAVTSATRDVEDAMRDEIQAIADLTGEMRGGITMSVETARAKLEEALARRANIDAAMDETRAIVMASDQYRAYETTLESMERTRASIVREQRDFAPAYDRGVIDDFDVQMQRVRDAQSALLDVGGNLGEALAENADNIRILEDALANAEDGMVTIKGAAVDLDGATTGLGSGISSATDRVYEAIPAMRELQAVYGVNAAAARELLEIQNQIALIERTEGLGRLIGDVDALGQELGGGAAAAMELQAMITDAAALSSLTAQASELRSIADTLFLIEGGYENMGAETRALYLNLVDASLGASELAVQTAEASSWAQALLSYVGLAPGYLSSAGSGASALAALISQAAAAAQTLAAALGGVMARLGQVGGGLAGLAGRVSGLAGMGSALGAVGGRVGSALGSIFGGSNLGGASDALATIGTNMSTIAGGGTVDFDGGAGGGTSGGGGGASDAAREAERLAEAIEKVVESLEDEIAMVGASEQVRRTQQALRRAGVELYSEEGQQIADLVEELMGAEAAQERLDDLRDSIRDVSSELIDAALNADSWADAWEDMRDVAVDAIKRIAAQLIDSGIDSLLEAAFSGGGGTGGGGGLWGMISGALGFGSASGSLGGGGTGVIKSFAGGGDTGTGPRIGGLDGIGGFPAIVHPGETINDRTRQGSSSSRQTDNAVTDLKISFDGEANIMAVARNAAGQVVAEARQSIVQDGVRAVDSAMKSTKTFGRQRSA